MMRTLPLFLVMPLAVAACEGNVDDLCARLSEKAATCGISPDDACSDEQLAQFDTLIGQSCEDFGSTRETAANKGCSAKVGGVTRKGTCTAKSACGGTTVAGLCTGKNVCCLASTGKLSDLGDPCGTSSGTCRKGAICVHYPYGSSCYAQQCSGNAACAGDPGGRLCQPGVNPKERFCSCKTSSDCPAGRTCRGSWAGVSVCR